LQGETEFNPPRALKKLRILSKKGLMIRVNLLKDRSFSDLRHVKVWAVKLLLVTLFLQTVWYWLCFSDNAKKQHGIIVLKKQIVSMEERKKEFLAMTPPDRISGAIKARNEWFREREKMPVFILSRLEKGMPPNIELRTFESGDGGGNMQITAPDMDTATSYLNGALGTRNVRITMVDRVPTGILAACTWNE
jgi:hypothetical protein